MPFITPPARTEIADDYPNPSNATARAGFGKLWDYATALLGLTGDPADVRNLLRIGPVISNRNIVDNRSFRVNQRALGSTVVLPAGQTGHDRWKAGASGCSYTVATAGNETVLTISAGSLVQVIEGREVVGGNYVMSWSGTSNGKIGAGSFAASGVPATGVAADTNLAIEFGTGTLSKVQLELGTLPTPFERRPYGAELRQCKRFLPTWRSSSLNDQVGSGQAIAPNAAYVNFPFEVETRAVITGITAGGSFVLTSPAGAALPLSGMTISVGGTRATLLLAPVASGLTAGNATMMQGTLATSFILFTGAEL